MVNTVNFFVNTALDTTGVRVSGAKARFYATGTTTPVTVYSDAAATVPHDVPLEADADGVFPPIYIGTATPLKVDVTDADDVRLGGYPVDPVVPIAGTTTGADAVAFSPTTELPQTDVQSAIEAAAALSRSRILGTVSETSGVPDGDYFENGTNANGEYSRLASGVQTCWTSRLTLTFANADYLQTVWTFPATFAGDKTTLTGLASGAVFTGMAATDCGIWTASNTDTQTTLRLWRVAGASVFTSGDSVTLAEAFTSGRWFT